MNSRLKGNVAWMVDSMHFCTRFHFFFFVMKVLDMNFVLAFTYINLSQLFRMIMNDFEKMAFWSQATFTKKATNKTAYSREVTTMLCWFFSDTLLPTLEFLKVSPQSLRDDQRFCHSWKFMVIEVVHNSQKRAKIFPILTSGENRWKQSWPAAET